MDFAQHKRKVREGKGREGRVSGTWGSVTAAADGGAQRGVGGTAVVGGGARRRVEGGGSRRRVGALGGDGPDATKRREGGTWGVKLD